MTFWRREVAKGITLETSGGAFRGSNSRADDPHVSGSDENPLGSTTRLIMMFVSMSACVIVSRRSERNGSTTFRIYISAPDNSPNHEMKRRQGKYQPVFHKQRFPYKEKTEHKASKNQTRPNTAIITHSDGATDIPAFFSVAARHRGAACRLQNRAVTNFRTEKKAKLFCHLPSSSQLSLTRRRHVKSGGKCLCLHWKFWTD